MRSFAPTLRRRGGARAKRLADGACGLVGHPLGGPQQQVQLALAVLHQRVVLRQQSTGVGHRPATLGCQARARQHRDNEARARGVPGRDRQPVGTHRARGLALRAVEAEALAVFKGQRAPVAGVQGMAPEQPLAQRRRDQGLMLRRRAVQRLRGRLQVAKGIDLRRAPRRPCSEGGGQLGRQGTHALAQAFGPQRRAVELGARAIHRRRQGARLEEAEQWP